MKRVFLLLYVLLVVLLTNAKAQDTNKLLLSMSFGSGVINGHWGQSLDGEINFSLLKRFQAGFYIGMMNSTYEVNPESLSELIIYQDADVVENRGYFQSTHRKQNSLGLHLKYNIHDSGAWLVSFGGGANYNENRESDYRINAMNSLATITYRNKESSAISYHLVNDIYYKVNESILLGLKTRFINHVDHNVGFMFSTAIRI